LQKSVCRKFKNHGYHIVLTPSACDQQHSHSSSWPESMEEPNCKTGTFNSQMVMDCSEGSPLQQLCKSLALIALLLGIVFGFYYHLE
jgi:nicotinamidase-related amidase